MPDSRLRRRVHSVGARPDSRSDLADERTFLALPLRTAVVTEVGR